MDQTTLARGEKQDGPQSDTTPKPSGGRRHAKLEPHRAFLLALVGEQEDITMPELAGALEAASGTKADPAPLSRWLIRHGYRLKKNPAGQRARSPRDPRGARRLVARRTAPAV